MNRMGVLICSIILVLAPGCRQPVGTAETVTTGTLFREMVDLHRLAFFPNPAFRTIQYSSFDHRSRLPGGPDWFANSDGFGGEPTPNFEQVLQAPDAEGVGEYLIADIPGPGAIVRLWSAAISGDISLYLDGQTEPVYHGPAIDFFHRTLDGFSSIEGLNRDRLEETVYQRDASYAPIPFARQMRLIWRGDLKTIHFYQVQVRLYDSGAQVESFTPQDLVTHAETIDQVTAALADPDSHLPADSSQQRLDFQADLEPGAGQDLLTLEGAQAIEHLSIRLDAEDLDLALRETLLFIQCDGFPWAQVQSPVGDFFGAAPGINPYRSLPFSVLPDGTMVCRFVMPFAESMVIRLENRGGQEVKVSGSALPTPFVWNERSLHFRARWRVDHELIASNQAVQDLPFLLAHGQGMYVGTTSILLNPNPVPTPYGSWWGEGDEKVFVDDEPEPSIFGTGSEDYYNYSWSSPDIFFFPYCGQPRNDGPGNRGFVTNYRWHILDAIPFQRNIRFFMELYSHERTPGLSYARMAYHYARPGITDDHLAIMPEDLRPLRLPAWEPAMRMGARNSVKHRAEDLVTDRRNTRFIAGRIWAGGRLLAWNPRNEGESKTFNLPITENGTYRIHLTAALTPRSGRLALEVDGQAVQLRSRQDAVDLHRPYRTLLRDFAIQDMELDQGRHPLTLKYLGAPEGVEGPEIGIDFIWIQKVNQ
jgi:hypothetical protein